MPLDPRLLLSFVVLADELHFGRAAERLNVAQPALSQQIRRLEQQVGSRLYTRNSRVVELTASGRAMLAPARAAILAAEQAERAAREAARFSNHPLRVGVNSFLDDVVPAIAAYAEDRSEVPLWLSRMNEPQGHEMLAASVLDAFVGVSPPVEGSIISRTRSIDVPLLAFAAADHPIAALAEVPLSTYRESPVAIWDRGYAPEAFDHIVDVFSEGQGRDALSLRECRPSVTGEGGSSLEAELFVGHAVGFGPQGKKLAVPERVRSVPFAPPLSLPTYVSWHAERSGIVDAFASYMSALA
jgi:DNA-binding transcriptional LysR family regulator